MFPLLFSGHFFFDEKIQKNLIKMPLMRQPYFFSGFLCTNHTFLFYDENLFGF